jgi:hypothetical protein
VDQAPAITSAASATFKVGQAGSFTIKSTGYPVAALTESGGLPDGVTFVDQGNGTAILSGTPAAGSGNVYTLTVSASNGVSPAATQTFNLTVDANSGSNTINGRLVTASPPTVTADTAASPAAAPSLGATSTSAVDAALRALLLDDSTVTSKPRALFES